VSNEVEVTMEAWFLTFGRTRKDKISTREAMAWTMKTKLQSKPTD